MWVRYSQRFAKLVIIELEIVICKNQLSFNFKLTNFTLRRIFDQLIISSEMCICTFDTKKFIY